MTIALLAAVVGLIGANSMNYVTPLRPGPDAGVFCSVAMQIIEGKALYRETIEAKPPLIFALNAAALWVGDHTFHSIRVLERICAAVACLLVFFILLTTFGRRSLATLGAIAFSLYAFRHLLLEEGNVTEEYAIVFVLAGILCVLRATLADRPPRVLSVGSGVFFAAATLTKEPFALSSVPWFLFLVLRPRNGFSATLHRTGYFILGALIPACAFLGYLMVHNSFLAWLERSTAAAAFIGSLEPERGFLGGLTLGFERLGSLVLLPTQTGRLAFAVGILAALALPAFVAKYRYVPLVALFAFIMEYVGATLSSALYGHYFLQVIPSFVLCAATAGALLIDVFDRAFGNGLKSRFLLVLIPCVLDYSAIGEYSRRLRQPFVRAEVGEVSRFVRTHASPGDHLWVSAISNSRFYVETGLTPPTVFSHFFTGWFTDESNTTHQQKVAQLKADLAESRPAWVIIGRDAESLRSIGLLDWLCAEYVLAPVADHGYGSPAYLYARNDRAATALMPGEGVRDTLCESVRRR